MITGPDGLGFQLARWFARQRSPETAGAINAELTAGDRWPRAAALGALLAEAVTLAPPRSLAQVPDTARPRR